MIQHNSKFEDLASAPVKQTDVRVIKQIVDPYGFYDDFEWTSSDVLMKVSIDAVGSFLGTATKKATVKLLGIVDTAVKGDLFRILTGIYDSDPLVEDFNYISQGYYYVEEVEYNYDDGYTTVTMYDQMWIAQNTNYEELPDAGGLTFPATVEELAAYMASAINVDLMQDFSELPNADYEILVDPYATISNATIQTVIQEIAAATGTTAKISDTTLVFTQFGYIGEAIS